MSRVKLLNAPLYKGGFEVEYSLHWHVQLKALTIRCREEGSRVHVHQRRRVAAALATSLRGVYNHGRTHTTLSMR